MFNIGQKVLYGKTGVCEIADICQKELIKNQKRNYYILKPLYSDNSVIYAPMDSDKIFIRPIISKQEAEELISKIPEIIESISDRTLTVQEYEEILNTHKCEDLVKLTRKLYIKKKLAKENRKKTGFIDERYTALAEKLLFGELACALEIPITQVEDYIEKTI